MAAGVARVVVEIEPDHLDHPFDYDIPDGLEVRAGQRVEVPFHGRLRRGLVVDIGATSDVAQRRPIRRVLGEHLWVTAEELAVLRWAAARYAASLGTVLRHALPRRVVAVERAAEQAGWYPEAVRPPDPPAPATDRWAAYGPSGAALLDALRGGRGAFLWRPLADEDIPARVAELVRVALAAGRDVLVVVPGPRSAVADAVVAAAGELAVDVRGAGERATYRAWLRARCGAARVVVGERGVAFWPLARLGLTVLVEEAAPSHKERRAPHHHAREVLLERARRARGCAVLVTTVPSAAAWRLSVEGRLRPVVAERGVERRRAPLVRVPTWRRARLSEDAIRALRAAVEAGRAGVVLAARRGEGHSLACTDCGWRHRCPQCRAGLAPAAAGVVCRRCGHRGGPVRCTRCGSSRTAPLAAGAARLGRELGRTFRGVPVAVLEGYGPDWPPAPAIVVATRGAVDRPAPVPVGAVVVADLDAWLHRPELDAAEDALRVAATAASWVAPRGPVVVETRDPDHHAVGALVRWDVEWFWRHEARLRAELGLPPARSAIAVVAEDEAVGAALQEVLPSEDRILGPLQVDGRWRWLILSADRIATVEALRPLRMAHSRAGQPLVVDVDAL